MTAANLRRSLTSSLAELARQTNRQESRKIFTDDNTQRTAPVEDRKTAVALLLRRKPAERIASVKRLRESSGAPEGLDSLKQNQAVEQIAKI